MTTHEALRRTRSDAGPALRGRGGSSGGEWQKFALARAYLRDAQVLILDEPTAALDAMAEYEVFTPVLRTHAGQMAVLISHRFSTGPDVGPDYGARRRGDR